MRVICVPNALAQRRRTGLTGVFSSCGEDSGQPKSRWSWRGKNAAARQLAGQLQSCRAPRPVMRQVSSLFQNSGDVALAGEVVDFIRSACASGTRTDSASSSSADIEQRFLETCGRPGAAQIDRARWWTGGKGVNLVIFGEQQFGQIRAVLARCR